MLSGGLWAPSTFRATLLVTSAYCIPPAMRNVHGSGQCDGGGGGGGGGGGEHFGDDAGFDQGAKLYEALTAALPDDSALTNDTRAEWALVRAQAKQLTFDREAAARQWTGGGGWRDLPWHAWPTSTPLSAPLTAR